MKKILLIVVLIVFVFCGFSISHSRFFEFLELKLLDVQFTLRGTLRPDPKIIIVAIDEESLQKEGQWPWPRDKLAKLVRTLSEAGARVIAFDVVFAEADRMGGDRLFADELKKTRGAVLGAFLDKDVVVSNIFPLKDSAVEGLINTHPDIDGVVRRLTLEKSFALAVVSKFTGFTPIVKQDSVGNPTHVVIGKTTVPVDVNGRMMINYLGRPGRFQYISAADIIDGKIPALDDAIVLIGATAAGLSDIRPTPFSSVSAGVEIHASAIDNILTGRFLRRTATSELINIASLILIGVLSLVVLSRAGILVSTIFQVLLMMALLGIGYLVFIAGLWIPVVYQILESVVLFISIVLFRYFTQGREKRRIHGAFKFYLAPAVIDRLLKNPSALKLGGERREITVLFADVRNFTTISERLEPGQLMSLMNDYFTKMTDIIMKEGGLVDKYIGDAIMAIFGAPYEQKDHAERACMAASMMQAAVMNNHPTWQTMYGIDDFKIGVGINTGPAYVGNMGSEQRFNYTAIGDTVNVASRLESLTKEHNAPIIVSGETMSQAGEGFVFQPLGRISVKGRMGEVEVFKVT